jgi:hypothetical protein
MAFLTYRQPGVYTRYIDDPTLVRAFGLFRIPAIVGPGKDTILIQNQILNRGYSRSVSLAENADFGQNTIVLQTDEHDLIAGDEIEITDYSQKMIVKGVEVTLYERAIVVFVQGATIVVDTNPDTVDGQPLYGTGSPGSPVVGAYVAAYSRVKEISMKDRVIPATDVVRPANVTGLDEDGYPIADLVTADCVDGIGFAPFTRNYRPNVDYAGDLVRDDAGNWYVKWLKAAYVVRENLAKNGRTNDITSGETFEFFIGHRGLSNSEGGHTPDTLGLDGADHYQDMIDSIYGPTTDGAENPGTLEKFVNGEYVIAMYPNPNFGNPGEPENLPYRITYVDPANGKITLDVNPSAAELQD